MISPQNPADAGVMLQDIVYAGLEALRAAIPLDLCAYLHATEDQGPQLFLGSPDLGSIDSTEAFSLFSALRDALHDPHEGDETMLLGGYLAVIDAVDASFKLRDTVEGEIAGERAVLVLLSDQADKVSLGAALVDRSASDALRATASAALEAAQRLGSR